MVVPIYDTVTNTRGFGRFPTISEVAIMFIATGWNDGSDISLLGKPGSTTTSDVNYAATAARGLSPTAFVTVGTGTTYVPWGFYNDGTNGKPAVNNGISNPALGPECFGSAVLYDRHGVDRHATARGVPWHDSSFKRH